jgi:cation:H+ antiporter
MPAEWIRLAVGLALLFAGGELLVRGASGLALLARVSPLVIGLTVVAYGTSAPELVVSLSAALDGRDDVAVGNVVGSNVFNVLAILGGCALLRPLVVARQLVIREVPILIAASFALLLLGADGRIAPSEGLLLCAGALWFTLRSLRDGRREAAAEAPPPAPEAPGASPGRRLGLNLALVAAGLAALVAGGRALVDAAVAIARDLGVDEAVIALTIVSAGTSLPEVATSAVATLRGQRDIAVGNVVGSNIFNILLIAGASSLAAGGDGLRVSPAIESFDLPVMTAAAMACLPIMARGHRIARWEGALFLAYYAAYTTYLLLAAKQHAVLPRFSLVMLEFVVPLTVATVLAVALADRGGDGEKRGRAR